MTTEYLKKRWEGTPVEEYYDWKLTFTGVKGDRWVGSQKILFDLTGSYVGDWRWLWSNIHRPINGQVKNFLVAIRTLCQAPIDKPFRIFVRGSKMAESGGLWHRHFLDFLSERNPGSEVTFCDPNEVPRHSHEKLKVFYLLAPVNKVEADILIDDAQIGEDVPDCEGEWEYYSLKKKGHPFLIGEPRLFSHEPPPIAHRCPCAVCEIVDVCSHDFSSHDRLRASLEQLGFDRCYNDAKTANYVRSDMKKIHVQLFSQARTGVISQNTPQDIRVAVRTSQLAGKVLRGEKLIEPVGIDETKLPSGWQSTYSYSWSKEGCVHSKCKCEIIITDGQTEWRVNGPDKEGKMSELMKIRKKEDDCPLVRGKGVLFQGVGSDFFYPTHLKSGGTEEVHVKSVGVPTVGYPYVFSQETELGYYKTSYSWRGYSLWIKVKQDVHLVNIPGLPPLFSKYPLGNLSLSPQLKQGFNYYVHRRKRWEIDRDDRSASFSLLVNGNDVRISSPSVKSSSLPIRSTFLEDWIRGRDCPPTLDSLSWRMDLIGELKVYSRTIAKNIFYATVLRSLPLEIVNQIDYWIAL